LLEIASILNTRKQRASAIYLSSKELTNNNERKQSLKINRKIDLDALICDELSLKSYKMLKRGVFTLYPK
jgi:predicted transcriptional regulator